MIEIGGRTYSAVNVGGTEWIAKRWKEPLSAYQPGDDDAFEEALILNAPDERAAINEAISRNAWG